MMRSLLALALLSTLLPLVAGGKASTSTTRSSGTTSKPTTLSTSKVASSSTIVPTLTTKPTSSVGTLTAACAIVSSSSAVQLAATPSATPFVEAALAYECLNSVPLNKSAAIALVDASEPYIQWQSDLAYLKNPPVDYFYPPHDVLGKLASVRANLVANAYANEYAFQKDFYQVFTPAHDGHFILYPDLLTKAFEWGRKVALVSISKDGSEIPQIYSYDDIVKSPSSAPKLLKIDGIEASKYVQDFAYTASFNQDADAAYNSMFYEKAFQAGGVSTGGYFAIKGRVRYVYPGANTTFTFSNGTTVTYDNVAYVKGDFSGVVDGPSFYQRFCVPQTTQGAAQTTTPDAAPGGPPGYPAPVITTADNIVSGYYLDAPDVKDVAVLSILAMESESPAEFQATVQTFIADAKAAGKKKIIIDLSANGGGYILQGYDLFRQFFPQIVQRDYTRFRENPAFLDIAHIFSDAIPKNYDPKTASSTIIQYYESWFNWRYDYNIDEKPFKSFEEKFAPHIHAGDPYTNIVRWNFNDPLTTINETYGFGIDITGYGNRTHFKQPFATEDIILLYDGYCASTCIIFSEFMIHDAGVKSIAMGGRPTRSRIQGMGGVKGAQSFGWGDIYAYAQASLPLASPAQAAVLQKLTQLPIQRSSSNSVNLRDLITPDHLLDAVPAQFVAEESDCRLYWEPNMVTDVTKVWEKVARTAWGGGRCVAGSLGAYHKRDEGVEERLPTNKKETKRVMVEREEVAKDDLWNARYGKKVIS